MGASETRKAQNEAFWREMNEIDPPDPGRTGFVFCECGALTCAAHFPISWSDYERVRATATHFVVLLGHESPELERIVERHGEYVIVEKQGEAAAIAEATDPRG